MKEACLRLSADETSSKQDILLTKLFLASLYQNPINIEKNYKIFVEHNELIGLLESCLGAYMRLAFDFDLAETEETAL